jgi:hypothetical protein
VVVGVGAVAVDGPTSFIWAILLVFGAISFGMFAERRVENGTSAFAPQAAAVPGTAAELEAIAARREHTEGIPLALFALCGMTAISLQGCIEMAVGTAVMGTIAATDRRTFGAQTEDKTIAVKGESRVANLVGNTGHVNISSFNRKVLLTGEVPDEATRTAVEREVVDIAGVQSIVNDLTVAPPTSFSSRSNQSRIQSRHRGSAGKPRKLTSVDQANDRS